MFGRRKSRQSLSGVKGTTTTVQQDSNKPENGGGSAVPPSYDPITSKYESIAKQAESIQKAEVTHNKGNDLKSLQEEKTFNDSIYEKVSASPASKLVGKAIGKKDTDQEKLENEKEKAQASKEKAEEKLKKADDKIEKSTNNRKKLEKHKGKLLVRVVQHASKLNKEHALVKEELKEDPNMSPEEKEKLKYKKSIQADVKGRQKAEKDKYKEVDRVNGHMERSEIASTILAHTGGIFGTVSDSVGVLADAGVSAKESVDKLAKAKDFWKEAKESFQLDGAADKADASFSYMASILSLLNTIYAVADLGKACVEVHKRRHDVSGQERFADARLILSKLADVFSNLIGTIGPYISFVPFLGSSLNIADNVIQLILGTVNLGSDAVHRGLVSHDKSDLWKRIEAKRKKYANSSDPSERGDARFFDIDPESKDDKRKANFDKIDKRRRELLEIVANNEKIEAQTQGNKEHSYEYATNFNKYRGAEAGVSSRIAKLREERHKIEKKGFKDEWQKKVYMRNYKRRMRAMEALELLSQYRTEEKAGKKMNKAIGHDVEGLITNFVKLGGNITKLIGEVTAATGYGASLILGGTIINIGEGGYELIRAVGSVAYKGIRKLTRAEANKENTRQEMGMFLYDKMVSLGPDRVPWAGDFFDLGDTIPDRKIRQERESMDELHNTINRGLDARMSQMLITPTKKDLINVLASAFSQDGGVEMGQDGM